MKNSKKAICFIVSLLMCTCVFALTSSADSTNAYKYENGETEIIIQGVDLSARNVESIIANFTAEKYTESAKGNILCTLFGHSYKSYSASITTHNYYTTVPHCRIEYYSINICSRCGHEEYFLLNTLRIGCH